MGQREKKNGTKTLLDTLGIEPSTSRKDYHHKTMLSERDNQLHHVPNIRYSEIVYSVYTDGYKSPKS